MNTLLVIGIIAVFLVGVGAAIYITQQSSTGNTGNTTTTTAGQATTTSSGGTTTTTTSSETVDITGAWYGTYTSSRGNGRWAWRIWKTSENSYRGLLRTTEPYSTGTSAVPITIQLNGNQITIGSVALGVTFTGTISGDTMSGTWQMTNGMDSGQWSGQRGETDITPQEPTTTASGTGVPTTTTTSGGGYNYDAISEAQLPLSEPYRTIIIDLRDAFSQVQGGAKLLDYFQSGTNAGGHFALRDPVVDANSTIVQVENIMIGKGYVEAYAPVQVNHTTYLVAVAYMYGGTPYIIQVYATTENDGHFSGFAISLAT